MPDAAPVPRKLDLKRDERLRIEWSDSRESTLPVAFLRQMCPCAVCRIAREEGDPHQLFRPATAAEVAAAGGEVPKAKKRSLKLSVVPDKLVSDATVTVTRAEPVGNYALRLHFSDGHDSGIFTWRYLAELSEATPASRST